MAWRMYALYRVPSSIICFVLYRLFPRYDKEAYLLRF